MKGLLLVGLLGLFTGVIQAGQIVVSFDDLPDPFPNSTFGDAPIGVVPDGYGGINWLSNWFYFAFDQPPYTAHSASNRALTADTGSGANDFMFVQPIASFDGAWFAGSYLNTVQFILSYRGATVFTSDQLVMDPNFTPEFLSSGYAGPVDTVSVFSDANGYYAMDDVTYTVDGSSAETPEPSTWMLIGLGVFLLAGYRFRIQPPLPH